MVWEGPPPRDLCVVSHEEDIDGLGSAAVALKWSGSRCLYLTGYFKEEWVSFSRRLRSRCRRKGSLSLVVSDLNPSLEMLEILDTSLSTCPEKKILWVDHHVWKEEALSRANSMGYVEVYIDRSMTSTESMIHRLGLVSDSGLDVIAQLSRDTDYGLYSHPLSGPLTDVIRYSLYRKGDRRFLAGLARKFSRGIVWDYEVELLWEEASEEKEKALEEVRRSAAVREVKGYRALFLYTDPILSSRIAIRETRIRDYDIAFVIYKNGSITIARGSRDINCAEIASKLGGGGHPHIAGAQIGRSIAEMGLEKVIEYISERL